MIELIYLTNIIDEVKIVDNLSVDWVFCDLEYIGKNIRQKGRDTIISKHSLKDVKNISSVIQNSKLIVRTNPIGEWSANELNALRKIPKIDMLMLPYFKEVSEVERFLELIYYHDSEPCLLIETMGAINNLDKILDLHKFKYVHIGLNDIHIERKTISMFEPFADGLLDKISKILLKKNQKFGIGGIGKIDLNLKPSAESILIEHKRLGSEGVILSRTFKGVFNNNVANFSNQLEDSINNLRKAEKRILNYSNDKIQGNRKVMLNDLELLKAQKNM